MMTDGSARLELHTKSGTMIDLLPLVEAAADYRTEALSSDDSTDFGQPADIETVELFSQLIDGAIVEISKIGNKTLPIGLLFSAEDSSGLSRAEQDLVLAADDAFYLLWQHPDQASEPVCWDIQRADLTVVFSDLAELRIQRQYVLTLTTLPWSRADQLATFGASASTTPDTVVVVEDGSSAAHFSASAATSTQARTNLAVNTDGQGGVTGWTGSNNTTLSVVSESLTTGVPKAFRATRIGSGGITMITSSLIPAVASRTYTLSAYARAGTVIQVSLLVVWWDDASVIGSTLGPQVSIQTTATRLSVTAKAPAGATRATISMRSEASFDVSAWLFEAASSAGTYFNGATTDTAAWDYAWVGTANASASTATPKLPVVTGPTASGGKVTASSAAGLSGQLSMFWVPATIPTPPFVRVLFSSSAAAPTFSMSAGSGGGVHALTLLSISGTTYNWSLWLDNANTSRLGISLPETTAGSTISIDAVETHTVYVPDNVKIQDLVAVTSGSKPAEVALLLEPTTTGSGRLLVYTGDSAAASPDMSPFLVAATSANLAWLGGKSWAVPTSTADAFVIPAQSLPAGTCAPYLELAATTAGTYTVTITATSSATAGPLAAFAATAKSQSQTITVTLGTAPIPIPLGQLVLPLVEATEGAAALVNTHISVTTTGSGIRAGALFLFNLDAGQVSDLTITSSLATIEIDAPYAAGSRDGTSSYWATVSGTTGKARFPSALVNSWAVHQFSPGASRIFTVLAMTTVTGLAVSGSYYSRGHSLAPSLAAS